MSDTRDRVPANLPPTSSVSSDRPYYAANEYGQSANPYLGEPFRQLHPVGESSQVSYPGYSRYQPHPSSQTQQPFNSQVSIFHSPQTPYGPVMAPPAREQMLQQDGPAFAATEMHYPPLYDDHQTAYRLEIVARIQKNFFRLGNRWTCYRRNYFNVHIQVQLSTVPNNVPLPQLFLAMGGHRHVVRDFAVALSAKTQDVHDRPGEPRELIQHSAKRNKETQSKPGLSRITPYTQSPAVPVPMTASIGGYPPYATQPGMPMGNYGIFGPSAVQPPPINQVYERLQFQKATLNNGKRRAQQQFYHLIVELYVDIGDGPTARWVKIASKVSEALVVRGRSPGHYKHDKGNDGTTRHGTGPGGSRQPQHPGYPVSPDPYNFTSTAQGWEHPKRTDYRGTGPGDGRGSGDSDVSDRDGVLSPNPRHYSSEETPTGSEYSEGGDVRAILQDSNAICSPIRGENALPRDRTMIFESAMEDGGFGLRGGRATIGSMAPHTRHFSTLAI